MIERWFTTKCIALVGKNGRALSGEALEAAEAALTQAQQAGKKLWTDRNGFFRQKERRLFAKTAPLLDRSGNPVRICGRLVKSKANFCSKCGAPAPGGWWRCGGCGKHIGNESGSCPHCGRTQGPSQRLDISDGCWKKDSEVFAERFELPEVSVLMPKGLNIQESQCAILLEGGTVADVLPAGFYPMADQDGGTKSAGDRSLVMVDNSEFFLPVCVEAIRTADDIVADLHAVTALRFDSSRAREFMCNLMGESVYLQNDAITASLSYDEIAHSILQDVDFAARDFCNTRKADELFKNADVRIELEDHIAANLIRNLGSIGMRFVRLKEVEFESELFARLRDMSGQIEVKRREIEFMRRADELANDAVRREAMTEHEMEDYMDQLAHEKGVRDELRLEELERMRQIWKHKQEYNDLVHENDLDDVQQKRQRERDLADAEFEQKELDIKHRRELDRRLAEQNSSLDFMKVETLIQEIRIEIEKRQTAAVQEATVGWQKIKQEKKELDQKRKIEMINAARGADFRALLVAEDDPEKREQLLRLSEQEIQLKMTPELLLAAAAARGNPAAAEALSRMNGEQLAAIERSKQENREIYEQMLQMNERMFTASLESLSKNASSPVPTTQIIK